MGLRLWLGKHWLAALSIISLESPHQRVLGRDNLFHPKFCTIFASLYYMSTGCQTIGRHADVCIDRAETQDTYTQTHTQQAGLSGVCVDCAYKLCLQGKIGQMLCLGLSCLFAGPLLGSESGSEETGTQTA